MMLSAHSAYYLHLLIEIVEAIDSAQFDIAHLLIDDLAEYCNNRGGANNDE